MISKLDLLKKSPPFALLPEDVLIGVAELLEEVKYRREAIIYHQEVTIMTGVDIIAKGDMNHFFMTLHKINGQLKFMDKVIVLGAFLFY
jgi:CBS domain-containing protein